MLSIRFAITILFETCLILHYSQSRNQNLNCPDADGWTRCRDVCFFASTKKVNWNMAADECKSIKNGSSLLILDNKEKDENIRKCLLQRSSSVAEEFWVDGVFNEMENRWVFAAGDTSLPLQYQAFSRKSAQDDSAFKCIALNKQVLFRWSSRNCYLDKAFICEIY